MKGKKLKKDILEEEPKKRKGIYGIIGILLCIFIALATFTMHSLLKIPKKSENILTYLKNLDDYTADVEFTFVNEKQTEVQNIKLFHLKEQGYRVEIGEDRILLFNDNEIVVKDKASKKEYKTEKEFDSLYKYTFLEEYIEYVYKSDKTRVEKITVDEIPCIKVSLNLLENNDNIYTGDLYINEESMVPYKLEIKNKDKVKTIIVKYNNFTKDNELDSKLFQ